jgi:VanZ family protein
MKMGWKVRGVLTGSTLIVDCPPRRANLLRIADFRLVNLQGVSVKRHLFNYRLTGRAYKRMRRFIKNWLPVLVWLGVIFLGSTDLMSAEHTSRFIVPFLRWLKPDISPESLASIHFIVRKGMHLSEYAVLTLLLLRAAVCMTNLKSSTAILCLSVWVACVLVAATDEFHQAFVQSRGASVKDIMIDSAGAILGLLIGAIFGMGRARSTRLEKTDARAVNVQL